MAPGGRDVFAKVIRVAPPNNFYPALVALAAGFALFHGQRVRQITSGQLPVVQILKLSYFLKGALLALSQVT